MLIKRLLFVIFLYAWFLPANSFAAISPLPSDQAFVLTTTVRSHEIIAEWHIAPGYYLYANRLHITVDPNVAKPIKLPQGDFKYDADLGRYEVYSGLLSIPVKLQPKIQKLQLKVEYQGCSQDGFCYPPIQKSFMVNVSDQTIVPMSTPVNTLSSSNESSSNELSQKTSLPSLLTNQNSVQAVLQTEHLAITFLIFIGLGLLLAFTPCVLPLIPILTSIIVGHKHSITTKKACLLSLTYIFGTAIAYALAGVLAAALGNSLQVWLQKPWIIAIVSLLFVLLALSLFGFYELRLSQRFQHHVTHLSTRQRGGTYAGVFFMGMLSTLIISPCVTAPLVGVLMYISQTGDLLFGASALFALGIGMGIPLFFIGISAGKWLPKSGPWMEAVKKIFGLLMLGMAIWLLTRVVSETLVMALWGMLLIGVAIFFSIYLPRIIGKRKFNRSLGFIVGLAGIFVMLGGLDTVEMMNKWLPISHPATAHSFIVVQNNQDLDKQLLLAQAAHKPVILDFYADWCESCITMDRNVFSLPEVKQRLANYVVLRADLSANTASDEALLKRFDVIAPPTVLFFTPKGIEANSQRIIGEVNAKEFLTRLNVFVAGNCEKEKMNC